MWDFMKARRLVTIVLAWGLFGTVQVVAKTLASPKKEAPSK